MLAAGALMLNFRSRDAASEAVAELAALALREDIAARGAAIFLSSGGTTPKQVLSTLSETPLDWSSVSVGLVDERFVPPAHAASNEKFVRGALLRNRAATASFVPLWSGDAMAKDAAKSANNAYASLLPASFILLGMGYDGHTASWFPGAAGLGEALQSTHEIVVAINASGTSEAGEITERITLTRRALSQCKHAVLLLFGAEKQKVFVEAMRSAVHEAPVKAAVEDIGQRLITVWAP